MRKLPVAPICRRPRVLIYGIGLDSSRNQKHDAPVPWTHEGRFAIVTNVGHEDAMDAPDRSAFLRADERADADGEVGWS